MGIADIIHDTGIIDPSLLQGVAAGSYQIKWRHW